MIIKLFKLYDRVHNVNPILGIHVDVVVVSEFNVTVAQVSISIKNRDLHMNILQVLSQFVSL